MNPVRRLYFSRLYPLPYLDTTNSILQIWNSEDMKTRASARTLPVICIYNKENPFSIEWRFELFKDERFYLESHHKNLSIYIFYLFPVTSKAGEWRLSICFLLRFFLLQRTSFTHFRRTLSQSEIPSAVCNKKQPFMQMMSDLFKWYEWIFVSSVIEI